MPTLKPVGHQSTNWMDRFVLIVAMLAFTSFGTTSPLYNIQQAMYLPDFGSHLIILFWESKAALVISETVIWSCEALFADKIGAYDVNGKCIPWEKVKLQHIRKAFKYNLVKLRGNGTKFVWNSFRSTFKAPENLNETVMELTIWAITRFKFEKLGLSTPKFLEQISNTASLSNTKAQSDLSIVLWVVKIELYGSTTADEVLGDG